MFLRHSGVTWRPSLTSGSRAFHRFNPFHQNAPPPFRNHKPESHQLGSGCVWFPHTGVNWHSHRSANLATGPVTCNHLKAPFWELPPLRGVGFDHNSEPKCSPTQENRVSEECKLPRGHAGQGWLNQLPVSPQSSQLCCV